MKPYNKILIVLLTLFFSCAKEEKLDDEFVCTVDYVEFVDDTNVVVKFDAIYKGETRSYFGKYTYVKENNNYHIGDKLVSISDFNQKGNEATFVFKYGENLGFFCAVLYEPLPAHVHFTFDAQAEKIISGKSVGKWKIKRRTNLRK